MARKSKTLPGGTKATPFRLTPKTKDQLRAIAQRRGVRGMAAAIEWLAQQETDSPTPVPPETES